MPDIRIRLDFTVAVEGDALPHPNINDLLEPGVRATIPGATLIRPGASIQIDRGIQRAGRLKPPMKG